MIVNYFNGSFAGAEKASSENFTQEKNNIIIAKCEGYPFRGTPEDMARDVLNHISKYFSLRTGLFPVILESYSGTDISGEYTTKIVFQVVPSPY